jgi:alkyl sulfatase BDS1-like metallo-beta-lactamase superfamily hydrolase
VAASPDIVAQLAPTMLFDALAVQVDGPRAWDETLALDVVLTDSGERYRLRLANGVLTYSAAAQPDPPDATVTLPSTALALLASASEPAALAAAGAQVDGDATVLRRLAAVLQPGDPDFAIVTPD